MRACQTTRAKNYLVPLAYLGVEHGTSRQEALDLRWGDINFNFSETGLITLYRKKNKVKRTEFLMPRTRQALLLWKSHLEQQQKRKKINVKGTEFVFCRLDGTRIKRFDSAWKRACMKAGLDDFHYHDLRHTFCSNLIMSGSNLKEAKEMQGHKDLTMTDRYAHLTLLHKHKIQLRLAEYYSNGD